MTARCRATMTRRATRDLSRCAEPADAEPVAAERRTRSRRRGWSSARRRASLADDHVAEAGRKVLRFHLARMLDYEAGTRSGEDAEDLHKMRVATRRQRAAWRVFGEAFRDGRTQPLPHAACARSPAGSAPSATSTSCSRPPTSTARTCRSPNSAPSSRCSSAWRAHRDDARVLLMRELDSDALPALARRLPRLRADGGRGRPAGRPDPAAPRPRHGRRPGSGRPTRTSVATSRSCAGPTSRRSTTCASPASGCATRSSSCARRSGRSPTPLIARVIALQDHLGLMHDADVSASLARTFLVEHGTAS